MTKLGRLSSKFFNFRPTSAELVKLINALSGASTRGSGALQVLTEVHSQANMSTYIVTDSPQAHTDQSIPVAEGQRIAKLQDDYIKEHEMIVIDGHLGN